MWSVGESLCVSVHHEPCKNGQTDRGVVWMEGFGRPKRYVLGGVPDSPGKGHFEGCSSWACPDLSAVNILNLEYLQK